MKHEILDSRAGLVLTICLEGIYLYFVIDMIFDMLKPSFIQQNFLILFLFGLFISLYGKLLKVSRGRLFSTGNNKVDIRNSIIYYTGYFFVALSYLLHLF